MPMEKKTPEEIAFNKKWNKKWNKINKLSPMMRFVSKEVGKAPKCNSSTAKKEVSITVATKKKK